MNAAESGTFYQQKPEILNKSKKTSCEGNQGFQKDQYPEYPAAAEKDARLLQCSSTDDKRKSKCGKRRREGLPAGFDKTPQAEQIKQLGKRKQYCYQSFGAFRDGAEVSADPDADRRCNDAEQGFLCYGNVTALEFRPEDQRNQNQRTQRGGNQQNPADCIRSECRRGNGSGCNTDIYQQPAAPCGKR